MPSEVRILPCPPGLAGVAQLVEHQPSKLRVAGSSPVSRSFLYIYDVLSRLSSGVEHFHGKEGVVGSNPTGGSRSARLQSVRLGERFS